MPAVLQIYETLFTSFWGVLLVLGVFFGLTDLLKHLGNRLDKRRGMEIFRGLMKDRFELMNNAVQFGADEKVLAELGRMLEKHADLSQLTELTEIKVASDGDSGATVRIHGLGDELQAMDLGKRKQGNRKDASEAE